MTEVHDRVTVVNMPPQNGDGRLAYTVEEAADRLGLSRSMVFKLLASGELDSIKIGRSRRITPGALDEFLAAKAAS